MGESCKQGHSHSSQRVISLLLLLFKSFTVLPISLPLALQKLQDLLSLLNIDFPNSPFPPILAPVMKYSLMGFCLPNISMLFLYSLAPDVLSHNVEKMSFSVIKQARCQMFTFFYMATPKRATTELGSRALGLQGLVCLCSQLWKSHPVGDVLLSFPSARSQSADRSDVQNSGNMIF